ncbi:RNA-binding protein [Clostridium sardiniense]|uniref:RNA-binding protein n=1 Tax=Clostridium sardiniense TaxID=29369 RepID=A0ABS7KW09_CLOSR|nr:YlmH/Sll1252 family protein [Clostridium sardiniense]MBY0754857.1 RNA-binding protein [Clostridium sardiniense]MDQ0461682.1 RNA-binding protein YlmH [Clostridium sardiniense]
MNKEIILKRFLDEEKNIAINLYEKMMLSYERNIPMFGKSFYPPNIWKFFEEEIKIKGLKVESFGAFKESERRMISFNNIYDTKFPIRVLEIRNSSKFTKVTHRNYLGSILSLGIERDKIGDLIVKEDICYVAVYEEIADYILMNLKSIGKTPCKITELFEDIEAITHEFKEETILISSIRIDSIVAKLTNKSRGLAQKMIDEGLVLINYNINREKSFEVEKDDRITIRKYGKYIIGDCTGRSKSGKYKINIKKYT